MQENCNRFGEVYQKNIKINKERKVRNLFPRYFMRKLVTRNYVLIIPEYGPHLILVVMPLTVYCLLLIIPRATAVGTILTPALFYLRLRKTLTGAVLPDRVHRGVATELMYTHYAVQWYVNASVIRDLNNSMRLVCEHTNKNIKKATLFLYFVCCIIETRS